MRGFLPPLGLTVVVTLLIFKQPNLSSSALMFVTGIGMLLVAIGSYVSAVRARS